MEKSKLSKPYMLIPLALLCCFLWGSAFPAVKTGYSLFGIGAEDSYSQILFAGMRFALAGVLVVLFGSLSSKKLLVPESKSEVQHCAVLSVFQTVVQYVAFYIGLAHTSGVKSSVLVSVNVFLSLIISSVIFRFERLTVQKLIGTVIGFAGVIIINLGPDGLGGSGFALNGEGAIIISSLAYAVSSVLIKKYSSKENPVMLSGWQFFIGGLIMIVFGAAAGGRINSEFNFKTVIILIYLALISAVAYTVWGILLKYNPVSKVSVMGFMNPVFGVLLSAVILRETAEAFNFKNLLALLFVCAGIYIVNSKFKCTEDAGVDNK